MDTSLLTVGSQIDSLTHRVMSAVSPGRGGRTPLSKPPHPQAVAAAARLSKQLDLVLAQHRQLRDGLKDQQSLALLNAQLKEKVGAYAWLFC